MSDNSLYLTALVGFIISGVLFLIVGLRADDYITVASSIVWISACGLFAYPLIRERR